MKQIKYSITFIICLLVFPLIGSATCDYEREAELSRIAANVGFSYSYEIDNNEPTFTVNITNITNDIYIEDNYGKTFKENIEVSNRYARTAKTVTFNIYSKDPSCTGKRLLTQYVNIPHYNHYSQTDECKKHPEFKYCGIWINTSDISRLAFEKELNDSLSKMQKQTINTEKKELLNFTEVFRQYYYVFVALLILIIAIIINKKIR